MPAGESNPLLKGPAALRSSALGSLVGSLKGRGAGGAFSEIMKGKPKSKEHLVYNPHYLCSWQIFVCRHGTVFNDPKIWYVAMGLFSIAITTGALLYLLLPRPQDLNTTCIFEIVLYFKVFIAFMLGLFMQRCLVRWFSCMVALTDYFMAIRKLCWLVNINAIGEEERDAIQRLAILSAYLLENEVTSIWAEDAKDRDARWKRLTVFLAEEALVHDHELAALENDVEHDARSARVWVWIGKLVCALDPKLVAPPMRGKLLQLVADTTEVIAEIKKYVQFQLPYMYSHMLALFVHTTNILIALACGAALAVHIGDLVRNLVLMRSYVHHAGEYDPDSPGGRPRTEVYRAVQSIAVQVFILLVQPMIYQACLEIASTLCDPFTHEDYGMPLHLHIDELRAQIKTGNAFQAMDLDQIEIDYHETKKSKLSRLMRKHTLTKGAAAAEEASLLTQGNTGGQGSELFEDVP